MEKFEFGHSNFESENLKGSGQGTGPTGIGTGQTGVSVFGPIGGAQRR